jgi:hypothetical protein
MNLSWKRRDDGTVDYTKADLDFVYGNKSYKGWCNLDAKDVYEQSIPLKGPHCDCKYDGQWGAVCEISSESFCINQCNYNGLCQRGFCEVGSFTLPSLINN